MKSVNRVALLGRLLDEPSRGDAGNTTVCNFDLETVEEWMSRNGPERRVTHHSCVAFGAVAKAVEGARAGQHVYIEGSLRADRDSDSFFAAEVVCSVAIPVAAPVTQEAVA